MTKASFDIFGKEYPSLLTGLRVYIDYERNSKDNAKSYDINNTNNRIKRICELGKPCNQEKFIWRTRDDDGTVTSSKCIDVATYLAEGT